MAAATYGMKLEDYISALEKETHKDIVIDIDSDTTKLDNGIKRSKDKAQQDPAKVPVEVDDSGVKDKRTFTRSDGKIVTVNVDADTSKAEQKINTISSSGGSPAVVPVDADTSAAQNKISSVANNPPTVKLNVDMQAPGADEMFSGLGSSGQVQVRADTSGINSEIKNAIPDKTVSVKATVVGEDRVKSLIAAIQSLRGKIVAVTALVFGKSLVDNLKSSISSLEGKTVTITTNRVTNYIKNSSEGPVINGTAHMNGTAFKSGSWGTKNSGKALAGEVGPELVVRGNKFFTVGDDGAEFFDYRQGDVIFNAAQTAEIFKKGKLTGADTRAHAFLEGNAFVSGGGSFKSNSSSSKKTSKKKASTKKKSTTKKSSKKTSSKKSSSKKKGKKKSSGSSSDAEYFDWIEVMISRIERKITNLGKVADSTYRTLGTRNKALKDEMSTVTKEISTQEKAYNYYIKKANSLGLSKKYKTLAQNGAIDIDKIKNKKLKEKIKQYQEWYEKAIQCKDAIVDLKEQLSELAKARFDNIATRKDNTVTRINSFIDSFQGYIDLAEAKGYQNNTAYYRAIKKYRGKERSKLVEKRDALISELNSAVNSGAVKVYSDAWYEMRSQIDDTTTAIIEADKAIAECNNSMRQIKWDRTDYAHTAMTRVADEATFMIGLLDEDNFFDDNGNMTDQGLAAQGLHAQNYNTYMRDADRYAKDIAAINKEIEKDPYNKDLLDRRNELIDAQQKSIESAEQEKKALQDLAKDGVSAVLDSLKELIDKYEDSLDSAKDLYEYQKSMKEKSENIAAIEKQLTAYSGDTSEESRKTIQQLKKDLADAKEDLKDAQYDKYISDTKELLDDLYSNYEKSLNDSVSDINAVLHDSIDAANNNADKISATIESAAQDVGYTVSEALSSSWDTSTGNGKVIDDYSSSLYDEDTSTNQALSNEQENAYDVYGNTGL